MTPQYGVDPVQAVNDSLQICADIAKNYPAHLELFAGYVKDLKQSEKEAADKRLKSSDKVIDNINAIRNGHE